MLLGTLPVMAAVAAGAPFFILPAGIPFIFEGIYAIIRVVRQAFGKKPGPGSFGGFLLDRGLSGKAVSGLYAGAGLAGAAVSILSAYLYL